MKKASLTLGPLLFHWDADKRRDFYFRVADEASVDCVYLGEGVCSKRAPFFEPHLDAVVERLQKAGKKIVWSSLALMTLPRETEALKEAMERGFLIEANDVAAIQILKEAGKGKSSFVIGPTINVLNEGALACLAREGACRVVFASELKGKALEILAGHEPKMEKEAQVFGRQPLAISMRCYHARAAGRDKDHCRFACAADPDGLEIGTLSGQKILTVNGVQTLSSGYLVLLEEILALRAAGFTHFRLSPQNTDMVAVARLYRELLDGKRPPEEVREALHALCGEADFINGFYHGRKGLASVPAA